MSGHAWMTLFREPGGAQVPCYRIRGRDIYDGMILAVCCDCPLEGCLVITILRTSVITTEYNESPISFTYRGAFCLAAASSEAHCSRRLYLPTEYCISIPGL
ncbi:uncharacterized protein PV06_02700 [Exophiala oligosperma]|uniref:Uncharacterized protein n=1 Tax=Exophiala oligosperma TaxID=215243 RepID=A0A0D2DVH1_9EURO|nr:uncharacterized protein PV06_02700 [Exophiala oligosperma]KIW47098.1 hypothetical protein PV06_02700 [Exophiala oligosperma]